MANTYTQLLVHIVFTVQGRENIIKESFRIDLEKYICGIITNNKSKALAIYCNPDHTHVLVGIHPTMSVATLVGDIKSGSSKWMNQQHLVLGKFFWQDGYGAFSYSKSQLSDVVNYILNQAEHHKKRTFKEEYLLMLQKANIAYDDAYLFNWVE